MKEKGEGGGVDGELVNREREKEREGGRKGEIETHKKAKNETDLTGTSEFIQQQQQQKQHEKVPKR